MSEASPQQWAEAMLRYIDASPSPWHAVSNATARLDDAGFRALREDESWSLEPGDAGYVVRDGSSLVAFRLGDGDVTREGFRIIGAHTDSPGLRVKPRAAHRRGDMVGLGVEVYGAPILATFTDRDLTLAGRVAVRSRGGQEMKLVHVQRPILRLPNLAIHLNRDVNDQGLKLNAQEELPLLLEAADEALPPQARFREWLAAELDVQPDDVAGWELAAADTQPGSLYGLNREYIADSQLDNLASCHAGLEALLDPGQDFPGVQVCAFFDHEEIGSESYKGADGTFLSDVLTRITAARGVGEADRRRALASSVALSADMAHAHHPNFGSYYDAEHPVHVNAGPVLKLNAKQRYTSDALIEATFHALCERADSPRQIYMHRSDLPCGSTIGPITASRLGVRSLDVGNPMWAMHSLRESAGALDHAPMIRLMRAFLSS